MWWFGLILLVAGLLGVGLGLFLRADQDGSEMGREQGYFGIRLAVISAAVVIISLVVFGYAIRESFFSN